MEDRFLEVAKQAALEAGQIIAKYYGKNHQYKFKNEDQSDFATQADLESEKKIVEIISGNFPSHNIIAEEDTNIIKNSQYTWAIDPLDGTFSFSIGMPNFAVSIGLLKNNKPFLGVIYHVLSQDLYWAQIGYGAFVDKKKIRVSSRNRLSQATIVMDYGHFKRREPKLDLYIVPLLKQAGHIFSLGSASWSMALVARGIQDGTATQAWIWDFTAGTVIIREAGGKVTDFAGNEPDWTKKRLSVVTSNGLIHDAILEVLKR